MAYFANGSEGEILQEQCERCPYGEKACPIIHIQMQYNYDQVRKGNEKLRSAMSLLVDESGNCQMLALIEQTDKEKPK